MPDPAPLDRRLSVAPMMERTDRHCRVLHRLLTRRTLLYSEMITTGAILCGDRERHLGFDEIEHPVALQLGGADPAVLAECAAIGESFGYDEINLNVGCPSERVRSGRFGAALMAEPALVAACVSAMRAAVRVPVTVKCRIGIDGRESFDDLLHFVDSVAGGGCETFIVHARIAVLGGLSPKQNREVPPLRPDDVYHLKAARPDIEIIINGGIATLDEVSRHLAHVDGAMIGRAAYQNPYLLALADRDVFGEPETPPSREQVLDAFARHAAVKVLAGVALKELARHLNGLYLGRPGARAFRRYLADHAWAAGATEEVLLAAAVQVRPDDDANAAPPPELATAG